MYNTDLFSNITSQVKTYQKGNWINMINPTENEIEDVCKNLAIEQDFIRYSLDYEEKARVDVEDDGTILFIIDVPIIEKENGYIKVESKSGCGTTFEIKYVKC